MTENIGGQSLKIKQLYSHIRMRGENSERKCPPRIQITRKRALYDNDSLQWLSENFIKKNGLRNWTWRRIIRGIIKEHFKSIETNQVENDVDIRYVEFIWLTFLQVSGIKNLKSVPVTDYPEHRDVKAIMFMYSLDCFLFGRLNKISREKDSSAIETLGPFAVALTKIINNIQ